MTEIDYDAIHSVFRRVDRQVWIVTSRDGPRRGGLTATWVSQAALDRENPVVLVGIAPNHFTADLIDATGTLALHLLTADQIGHAWNFAIGSGRDRDKFDGVATMTAATGTPILSDCLAWLDCRVFARLDGGDRVYYWADVIEGKTVGRGPALTESQLIASATEEQKQLLLADLDSDVQLHRPLARRWREALPSNLLPE